MLLQEAQPFEPALLQAIILPLRSVSKGFFLTLHIYLKILQDNTCEIMHIRQIRKVILSESQTELTEKNALCRLQPLVVAEPAGAHPLG